MKLIQKCIKLTKGELSKTAKPQKWLITEKKFLTISEVQELQGHCQYEKTIGLNIKNFRKIRKWFMVELGLHAGLRVTEMAQLQHRDLMIDEDRSSILALGKGNKLRAVKISQKFKAICIEYIKYKQLFGFSTCDESYLLNSRSDSQISKRALQRDFEQVVSDSGLSTHYHIHNLRHTYVTHFLKASQNNYRLAQVQAGHSSIKTTQTYAGVLDEELNQAVELLYKIENKKSLNSGGSHEDKIVNNNRVTNWSYVCNNML